MARRRNQKDKVDQGDTLVELVEEKSSSSGDFLEDNQKTIVSILLGIAVLVAAWFAFNNLVRAPKAKAAMSALSQAQYQFERDSFTNALSNPGGGFEGFLDIIKNYGSTPAGNTAKYYAGVSYLHLGDSNEAINHLNSFKPKTDLMAAMKNGVLGDAYSELQDYSKALSSYQKAASSSENEFVAAQYLKKLGMLHEYQGDKAAALQAYSEIKEKYPKSAAGQEIDKLIARVQ